MKRDSFILYTEINDVVKELEDDQKGKLFQAILDYESTGEVPEMDTLIKCVFIPIKRDLDENNEKWDQVKKARSEAGKKGMESRYNKTNKAITKPNTVITNDNKAKQDVTNVTVYEHEDVDVDENINNKTSSPPRTASDARFDIFWQTYPKKVGKKAAQSAWKKAKITSEQFQDVIRAIEEQKQSDQWNRGYIPNPATWLNQGRWDDEVPEARAAPGDVLSEVFAEMERKEAVG